MFLPRASGPRVMPCSDGLSGPYVAWLWRIQWGKAKKEFIPVPVNAPQKCLNPHPPASSAWHVPSLPSVYNNNNDNRSFDLLRSHSDPSTRGSSFTPPWEARTIVMPSCQVRKLRPTGKVMGPRPSRLQVKIYSKVCLTQKHLELKMKILGSAKH